MKKIKVKLLMMYRWKGIAIGFLLYTTQRYRGLKKRLRNGGNNLALAPWQIRWCKSQA
jgi:hypothetical protein